jgi:hypothetical protein
MEVRRRSGGNKPRRNVRVGAGGDEAKWIASKGDARSARSALGARRVRGASRDKSRGIGIVILRLRNTSTQEQYLYTSSVRETGTRVSTNDIRKLRGI